MKNLIIILLLLSAITACTQPDAEKKSPPLSEGTAESAGLSSTAQDYATFLQMYLNAGEVNGKRILSRTTIQSMMGNQNPDIWGENAESYYAMAFSVTTQRGQDKGGNGSIGTFRWGGYFNTQYFADPEEKVIGILMKQTQDAGNDDTGWKFPILVGQAVND